MSIPSYRLTQDDLPDLDKKTAEGIDPLLQALNNTLVQMIGVLNALNPDEVDGPFTLTTGAAVADSFPFTFKTGVTQPKAVVLANIQPKDPAHSLTSPFVMQGYTLTSTGQVAVSFITGLLPNNSYQLTFVVR